VDERLMKLIAEWRKRMVPLESYKDYEGESAEAQWFMSSYWMLRDCAEGLEAALAASEPAVSPHKVFNVGTRQFENSVAPRFGFVSVTGQPASEPPAKPPEHDFDTPEQVIAASDFIIEHNAKITASLSTPVEAKFLEANKYLQTNWADDSKEMQAQTLSAVEFGYRCCEKGMSLQATLHASGKEPK
jgi:hypothetical protein